jgi:Arm domain-containing DNA-binding protein
VSTETASRKLTSAYIAALKPNVSICDISDPAVPGLVLRVAVSGSKAWLFRFKWDGAPTRITLGKFPALGLAEARQLALKNREWLDKGIDPRRAVDRLGKRNGDDRATHPAKSDPLAPGQEPPNPSAFETRLAATPKDRIPRPDPGDRSSVLFIAHEYIEKWFKAQGKNSKEACRMLRADVLPKWHWRDGRTI